MYIQYLETLGDEDEQKSEYSLTQHLANNLIDMYINLPSKNHYRRPATYASKGYRTRRMAVDFAVPLITNVKVAKLLFEALVRRLPLDVSPVDFKTSHETHTFPGLINISAFVPELAIPNSKDLVEATKAAISGGFVTSLVIPVGEKNLVKDRASLELALSNTSGASYGNYGVSIAATQDNMKTLDEEIQTDVKSLFIPYNYGDAENQVSTVAAHFASWPPEKPIITDAKGSNLAPVLLLAGLHDRSLHVTDVQSKEDVLLISLSKAKKLKVTCDVSVYALFYTREQFPESTCLPSAEDQKVIWQNLDAIDAFSVGTVPYRLARDLGKEASSWSGIEEALPLLLSAVAAGKLRLEDIRLRLHDNPVRIFALPDQGHTHIEVVVRRKSQFRGHGRGWSPLDGTAVNGSLHRVLVHGQTAYLDGTLTAQPVGRNISSAPISHLSAERTTVPSAPRPDFGVSAVTVTPKSPEAVTQVLGAVAVAAPPTVSTGMAPPPAPVYGPVVAPHAISHLLPHPAFNRRHILSVKQFGHKDVHDLFSLAHEMQLQVERNGTLDILKGKVLCTLFYEPSTRTSSSFDAAMKRCGGQVINVDVGASSVQKGETLPDTIRTLGCYADAIVIRHPDVGSSQLAAKFSPVPIINAGDGIGEHPTQVRTLIAT